MMVDTRKNKQHLGGELPQQYSRKKKRVTPSSIPMPIEIPGLGTVYEGVETDDNSDEENIRESSNTTTVNMTGTNEPDRMAMLEKRLEEQQETLKNLITLLQRNFIGDSQSQENLGGQKNPQDGENNEIPHDDMIGGSGKGPANEGSSGGQPNNTYNISGPSKHLVSGHHSNVFGKGPSDHYTAG